MSRCLACVRRNLLPPGGRWILCLIAVLFRVASRSSYPLMCVAIIFHRSSLELLCFIGVVRISSDCNCHNNQNYVLREGKDEKPDEYCDRSKKQHIPHCNAKSNDDGTSNSCVVVGPYYVADKSGLCVFSISRVTCCVANNFCFQFSSIILANILPVSYTHLRSPRD